jgi:enediyne biosynthesis protein E4
VRQSRRPDTRQNLGIAVFIALVGTGAVLAVNASPALQFKEVAEAAGVRAEIRCGGPEKLWIPEANGSGVAWLDYDNDGRMDLLIVNGSDMAKLRRILGGETPAADKGGVFLFHNLGGGKFEDVTAQAGLKNPYWGTGANAADIDNDGYTDILITTIGVDLLYRNNGNGTFTEIGKSAGLSRAVAWHTGSAFGDFDGDGKLDLFVTGYVDIHSLSFADPAPLCDYQGKRTFCGPIGLKGEHGILYHNNGDGTFSDRTREAGLGGVPAAHGFTVVADDFNQDGKTDLFVANDSDPNFLFLNQGNGTFKEAGLERGVAFNADGRTQANMGVAVGDLTHNGKLDLLTTTFHQDYFPLFRANKAGYFEEIAAQVGLTTATMNYLGWACGLTDFDNGGERQFWSANGHVYPQVASFWQPFTIFRSVAGRFSLAWAYPQTPQNSYRGAAVADYDNDGRMDVVVLPITGQPVLLHNEAAGTGNWVGLSLRGTRSNRDAIGASVQLEACGAVQYDSVRNGGSYLSRNDPRLHFGLGNCAKADRLTVRWPSGTTQVITALSLNQFINVEEPR